ncbi:MAG: zinc ABC transporter substrate-binding protein [Rhodothermia bacterium]|nr:zinc ABC transporter substrate-binding protein [Rhodothermia bacterium]
MLRGSLIGSFLVMAAVLVTAFGCSPRKADRQQNGKLNVVATTNLVGDLAAIIGGEAVEVTSLMGPGVDPHLYKASEGDVRRMAGAEAIFYGGLHLEGKMTDIFEQMKSRNVPTFAVTVGNPDSIYIESPNFGGNYDPHIWFDVSLWKGAASFVAESLSELVPEQSDEFQSNLASYLGELDSLDSWVRSRTNEVPESARVVITSHDAFGYFGRAYGYEVRGLQGISTATEAGAADVQDLAEFVASNRIPAMFVASSVQARGIEAVREAVRSRGFDVRIGGNLFSDALGAPDTPEGTYVGMFRHNVNTIVDALSVTPS